MQRDEVSVSQTERQCFAPLVDDAVVLTGPTASGKSSVAIELAQMIDGEILSLDSIAVYRSMDIGTAKPTIEDQKRVPHHLINVVDANEDYSVACYLKAAHEIVADLRSKDRRAIFVGGTPMFLKGVLRGFDPGPPPDWEFRQAVERDVEKHGAEALRQRLRQVDPLAAHNIGPNDVRRMIRALEVHHQTGQQLSHRQVQFSQARSAAECFVFAMQVPRDQLHQRINRRVDEMFDAGLVDEVKALIKKNGTISRTAAQAVGYRELIERFDSTAELSDDIQETVKEEIKAHTRQLARRQETWFRSFAEIRPIPAGDGADPKSLAQQIAQCVLSPVGP